MPLRREKIRQAVDASVQAQLEPGEQIVAQGLVVKGPSPWLIAGILGWIGWLFTKYYFLVVTDRRVLFERTTMMFGVKPRALEMAEPRASVAVVQNNVNPLWSKLKIRHGDGTEARFWYHRIWRDDIQQVVQALSSPAPATGGTTTGFSS
jgi:hypothetical protein